VSFLLDAAYLAGLTAAAPWLAFKALTSEKYRTGYAERLGRIEPREGERPCTWLHAVSVGEMNLVRPLVAALEQRWPKREITLSTATNTGRAAAAKHFPDHRAVYFPLDFSCSVRRALRRIRPDLILLVELELWPNFLAEAQRQEIPVAVVNGRVSDRSFPRYRFIRPLVRRWLQRVGVCCMQNETYAERLRELGAPEERVMVTGNLKFDATPEAPEPDEGLRQDFGLEADEPLLVGGCTWPGEDEALLGAVQRLKEDFPRLRLLLAPRQADRFDPVERLVREAGLPCVRRTALQGGMQGDEVPPDAVFLLDTVGELAQVYGLGTVVFVGGSLRPHGGHNIIEPSGLAKAVLFGPHTDNFRDITDELVARDAAIRVADEAELEAACRRLLADPAAADELGARARRLVDHHRGATERTLDAIERVCSIRSG
jgi:3-deoxy-D-manno-octulosonic-acid transferase